MTAKNTEVAKPQREEWDVISEPRSTIEFDTIGDEWEGFYEGIITIHNDKSDEDYEYLAFRDSAGEAFQVSASYDLKRAFEKITEGTYVKMILVDLKPSKKGNDLKLYKVLVRK